MALPWGFWPVDALQREKFEIVVLIEPRAFEVLEREVKPPAQRERIDRELDMRMRFLFRIRLVIEDV